MKHKSIRWTLKIAIVMTQLLLATALSQAQTYTVTVPVTNPVIARVKLTLEGTGLGGTQVAVTGTNPSINGGATFSFNGGNPISVGSLSDNGLGDIIRVDLVNGNVVVQYLRNGHFNLPGYCNAKLSGQSMETLTITVTGATTINDFHYNSYSVPGSQGVAAVDCSKASRRVSGGASVMGTSGAFGADFGRHPLDVILVLDKSGSMLSTVDPQDLDLTHTKWLALQNAAGEFVDHFSQADPFNHTGADRLAVVFYSTTTNPVDKNGVNFIRRDSGNWPTIKTAVQNEPPGGFTAMGTGIQVAVDGWKAHANPDTDDATIVLMTDGLQNTGPQVTTCSGTNNQALNPGCGPDDPAICGPQPGLARLSLCGIPMETTALGVTADHSLVDAISQQTAGISKQALTQFALADSFADSLVDLLKGNSESVLLRAQDTFTGDGGGGQLRQTLLDGSVKRAIFVLGWQPVHGQTGLDLQIIPPGGCTGTPLTCTPVSPTVRSDGPYWTVQSVDIPTKGPTGEWSVRVVQQPVIGMVQESDTVAVLAAGDMATLRSAASVVEPRLIAVSETGGKSIPKLVQGIVRGTLPAEVEPFQTLNIPYHLSAYSVEGRLSYRLTFTRSDQGTGDSLVLQAQMNYDGKPLIGLGDAIKVRIERPNTGEGTYLHDTPVSDDVLTHEPTPGDQTTPYERKIQFLAKNGSLASTILPQPVPTEYVMKDNGDSQNGDAKADDGVYSTAFSDTSRPGLYRFTITMDWDKPATSKIHRIEIIEREVKVNATPGGSQVIVTKGVDPGSWIFSVTPKDKFGNYTGPGFADHFVVNVTGGGSFSGPVADSHQTGVYTFKLVNVPAGSDPSVTITVDGNQVRNCKLSSCGSNSTGSSSKFAIFADLGVGIPHGNFSNAFDPGVSFNAGLEYIVNTAFSAEGIFGAHHFPGKIAGDVNAFQFTGGGKVFFNPGPNRVFARAGLGGYHFDSGTTNFGGYFGVGLLHEFNAHLGLEGVYTFHTVNTPVNSTQFSTVQGGIRYVFH